MIVCFAAVLSVSAFAANIDDYAFITDDGSVQYDMDAYHYSVAQEMVLESGVDIDPAVYFLRDPVTGDFCGYDFNSFLNDYDFAVAATNPPVVSETVEPLEPAAPPLEVETEIEVESDRAVLSDVLEDDEVVSMQDVEVDEPHQYVVNDLRHNSALLSFEYGSDIPLRVVEGYYLVSNLVPSFSQILSGELFTSFDGYTDRALISDIFDDIVIASTDQILHTVFFLVVFDNSLIGESLPVGIYFPTEESFLDTAGVAPDILQLYIPGFDFGGDIVSGTLKSIVVSIFGEYTPVNTTALLMETIENETTTTLVDVVASGMAGVDWEWCAGVFLFGIMLYCLFKLLGGILS